MWITAQQYAISDKQAVVFPMVNIEQPASFDCREIDGLM